MPMIMNKSVRIWALDAGMVPPGGSIEVTPEEMEKPYFQQILASGELVEDKDQKKIQQVQQQVSKAEEQVSKAQEAVSKTQEQVSQQHAKQAEKAQQK